MNTETKYPLTTSINLTTVKTIENFSITLRNFVLFTSVDVLVSNYDISGNFISSTTLNLNTSNGYSSWLADDTFLINWVKTQLSYT